MQHEDSPLKSMKNLIEDLRSSKMSLPGFIHQQSLFIDSLSTRQHPWKREYTDLVLQIDRISHRAITEDDIFRIERSIKAMEFMLSMADKG